ncbi:hypothetical protein BJY17_000004 [Agromyces hippuratus]|uniref:Multidrug transporter n=1 Tax=Agromyces hippuratus TaxID=286438 RepID=A0A852WNC2_9MICO|nr:hypothetical protein [Agromyces hippuratus]NYG19257.1 hypothetical protein [Agromyces hippuratus]
MRDPDPADSSGSDQLDEAVEAAEQHQQADEDADPNEHVVVRDPETGRLREERAQ